MGNVFEKGPGKPSDLSAISLEAAQRDDFQNAVNGADSRVNAIRAVRELLSANHPYVSTKSREVPPENLPPGRPFIRTKNVTGLSASDQFEVAKHIVDLIQGRSSGM